MPRKSKKGGGGSQTEGERLLLQQRRAQTEEEVTRQREEMLTLFLKVDHQKSEHFPQGCFPSREHNVHQVAPDVGPGNSCSASVCRLFSGQTQEGSEEC